MCIYERYVHEYMYLILGRDLAYISTTAYSFKNNK